MSNIDSWCDGSQDGPMHRAAIIGCGSIATAHAYGVDRSDGIELVGLADLRRAAAVDLAGRFGIDDSACFGDYREMLDTVRPDVVFVALWHGQHAEATIAAASRGARLIICEKPMAGSLGEAADMIVACRREGALLAIAHQRRFYPGWTIAREALAAGAVGTIRQVDLQVRDGLLNSATHSVDLARFILGDPATEAVTAAVTRRTDRYERGMRTEDAALALVVVEGGVRIVVESDLGARHISANATVIGSDGVMAIEENHVRLLNSKTAGWHELAGSPFGVDDDSIVVPERAAPLYDLVVSFGTATAEPFVENYVRQVRESVDWLDGALDRHRGDAAHGYATLEILMGIYESARLRETVTMPVETRLNPLDLLVESGALPVTRPGRYDIRAALVRGEAMSWT